MWCSNANVPLFVRVLLQLLDGGWVAMPKASKCCFLVFFPQIQNLHQFSHCLGFILGWMLLLADFGRSMVALSLCIHTMSSGLSSRTLNLVSCFIVSLPLCK